MIIFYAAAALALLPITILFPPLLLVWLALVPVARRAHEASQARRRLAAKRAFVYGYRP